jgi:uncharacterized membrane protein
MELYTIFLILHIVGGTIGLLSGTINIIRRKGDKYHRLAGKFFFYGMLTAGVFSFALSILHPNYFLFIVGVFTIYMVLTGERYLHLRGLASGQKPKITDWTLTILMLVAGAAFVVFGIYNLFRKEPFSIPFIVFGILGLRMVSVDYQNYTGKSPLKNAWLVTHLQRMTGAYIAALTAFLSVNVTVLPPFIIFILPTVLLFPVIYKWTKKFQVKKKDDTSAVIVPGE